MFDAVTQARRDVITPLERELIDQHMRQHGVTSCPARTYSEGLVHPAGSSPEAKAVSRRIQARKRRFDKAGKAPGAPPADLAQMIGMAETMTAREIGKALGLNAKTVARRLGRHGVSAVREVDRNGAARRDVVKVMMAEGRTSKDIAETTGANRQTIYDDIRILVEQGCPRLKPKCARMRIDIEERRKRVGPLRAEGLSLAKIAQRLGVSIQSIRGDLKALEARGDA